MDWIKVGIDYTAPNGWQFVEAMNCAGGVLVKTDGCVVYVPGYRIKRQRGDMDCNELAPVRSDHD